MPPLPLSSNLVRANELLAKELGLVNKVIQRGIEDIEVE